MTPAEHKAKAEELLALVDEANYDGPTLDGEEIGRLLTAQVHATLALYLEPAQLVEVQHAYQLAPARLDLGAEGRKDRAAAELILDLAQPGMGERYRNENADKLVCRTHSAGPTLARLARDKAETLDCSAKIDAVEQAIARLGLDV